MTKKIEYTMTAWKVSGEELKPITIKFTDYNTNSTRGYVNIYYHHQKKIAQNEGGIFDNITLWKKNKAGVLYAVYTEI